MSGHNYVCNFNLDDCIKTLGMDEKGKVQQYITEEFKKNVQEFVPFDIAGKYEKPGQLIDSCHIENETDVVWNAPYAKRHYYHPEYDFQGKGKSETMGAGRGAYWADRYMQNGGKEYLEQGARGVVKK